MKTDFVFLVVALAIGYSAPASAADRVRVDASSGVPQIKVDDVAVRSRVFFGIPGRRALKVGPQGRALSFEFTPIEDEPDRATIHFRFGHSPGDVYVDDIRIADLTSPSKPVLDCDFQDADAFEQQWHTWPPRGNTSGGKTSANNTVGKVALAPRAGVDQSPCLHIQLTSPTDGNWPDFHIYHQPNLSLQKGHRYRVSFWARATSARSLAVALYRPGKTYTFLGGPPSCFESQIKLAADADVDFVSFPVHMPWPQPDQPVDWSVVDRQCQTVLDANPQALLIPRIGMSAPRWWQEAHSQAVMVWDRGPQKRTDVVVASPLYLHDAAARLEALVRHLETKFGPHMAGYHPCGQNTGEWFYQETWGAALNGYSDESIAAWRRWLRAKYHDDRQLQEAWHDRSVTLQTATVASPELRRAAPTGALLDPIRARSLIDFAEFQQAMMANCVCHFARIVRRASQGNRLVVFFYGYVHEFGIVRNGPATSGHYALRQVLDCPDIDILCSPISYFDRGLGQSGPAMTAAESVTLAGKMWLVEDDTRTYLATGKFPGWQDGVETIEETNQLLLRNTAQCAVRNFGTWWMDLGATGWFDDPRMWQQMKRLRALDGPLLKTPRPFRPEVAVVVDPHSMLHVAAGGDAVTRGCVYEVRRPLGRFGAPYGQYLLDDVLAGKVKAKLYVFANVWQLSPQQRRRLLQVTKGATTIWCYAPGYYDSDSTSLAAMKELTRFAIKPASAANGLAQPTEMGQQFGVTKPIGVDRAIRPLFAVADAHDQEILARYSSGEGAVALRKQATVTTIFVGPPGLTAELVRLAAKRAGVHLFTETDCNIYANGPYLVLHASQDGAIQIDTGHSGPVHDLLENQDLGRGPHITLRMKKGDTRILELCSEVP